MIENSIDVKQCPDCHWFHEADDSECPMCGHVYGGGDSKEVQPA